MITKRLLTLDRLIHWTKVKVMEDSDVLGFINTTLTSDVVIEQGIHSAQFHSEDVTYGDSYLEIGNNLLGANISGVLTKFTEPVNDWSVLDYKTNYSDGVMSSIEVQDLTGGHQGVLGYSRLMIEETNSKIMHDMNLTSGIHSVGALFSVDVNGNTVVETSVDAKVLQSFARDVVRFNQHDNTRDDTGDAAIANVLYTDAGGTLLSAPLTELKAALALLP